MPMESDAQRRAMYAAVSGRGKLGIPKKVARKFIRHGKMAKMQPKRMKRGY